MFCLAGRYKQTMSLNHLKIKAILIFTALVSWGALARTEVEQSTSGNCILRQQYEIRKLETIEGWISTTRDVVAIDLSVNGQNISSERSGSLDYKVLSKVFSEYFKLIEKGRCGTVKARRCELRIRNEITMDSSGFSADISSQVLVSNTGEKITIPVQGAESFAKSFRRINESGMCAVIPIAVCHFGGMIPGDNAGTNIFFTKGLEANGTLLDAFEGGENRRFQSTLKLLQSSGLCKSFKEIQCGRRCPFVSSFGKAL